MASLSGWSEVALLSVAFVLLLGTVTFELNRADLYNDTSRDGSFGLTTDEIIGNFTDFQETIQTGVATGEASTNTQTGISLTSIWFIMKEGINITWGFINGTWLETLGGMAKLPSLFIAIMRILFVLSIGFILIKLIMKVKP